MESTFDERSSNINIWDMAHINSLNWQRLNVYEFTTN